MQARYYELARNIELKRINTVFWNQLIKDNNRINKDPLQNYCPKRDYPVDGHCISECLAKHLLIQLLTNITVIFVKKLLKNLTISIYVLLETNLVKKTLNVLNIYGNWKRKLLINLLIMILLWNYRNMFVIPEGGIYAFVRRILF